MAHRVTTTKEPPGNLTILTQSDVNFYRKSIPLCSQIARGGSNPLNNNILLEDNKFNNNNIIWRRPVLILCALHAARASSTLQVGVASGTLKTSAFPDPGYPPYLLRTLHIRGVRTTPVNTCTLLTLRPQRYPRGTKEARGGKPVGPQGIS